jgi:hypothetical protein
MNPYYLIASLPMLQFGAPPPLPMAEFLEACGRVLPPAQATEAAAVLCGAGKTAFARRHAAMESALVGQCARLRAAARGEPGPASAADGVPDLTQQALVQEAFTAPDPKERERRLDALRWRWLEEEARRESFSLSAALAYGLQLQIAERWAARTEDAGQRRLEQQLERLLQPVHALRFEVLAGKGGEA